MKDLPRPVRVVLPLESGTFRDLPSHLRAAGLEPVGIQTPTDRATVASLLRDADAVIVTPRISIDRDMLAASPRLRAVVSAVIGVDTIDVDACTEAGIVVANGAVPENYLGMAEATVMLILVLLKDLKAKERSLRTGNWRLVRNNAFMLKGKTVGLIGAGRIARGVATRLQGWDVRIIGYDPYVPAETMASAGIEPVSLEDLLRQSDVVSVHVVLTPETRGIISAREIALMKPTAYLINTSRGEAVNEADLARALKEGRIAGAAIDVFAQEPVNMDNPLFEVDPERLILTGHCVGHSVEQGPALVAAAVENVARAIRGEDPLYIVNPAVLPRWRERLARLDGEIATS